MKNLSFKIEEDLHRGLKLGAALEGRPIVDVIKSLILGWVREKQDPILRAFANAPQDDEPLTAAERKALKEAEADLKAGRVEEIS